VTSRAAWYSSGEGRLGGLGYTTAETSYECS
jgi:hypothetical protein